MQPKKALDQASTKGQLETIIAGLTEGVILLGFEGAIRYANTAALRMHGLDQLEQLGTTTEDYNTTFKLTTPDGRPLPAGEEPLERLLKGESFGSVTVKLTPRGSEESWVHDCRGLQVSGDGKPEFAVLVLQDISEQLEAEARFEQTFEANPAPAVITRLSDLRYVKVNEGFLTMTGFKREEIIGQTVYAFDILAGVNDRSFALERLKQGQMIPQLESYLSTKANGTKFVVVAGQPLELADENCMLFSFIDLDERKKAEDALRQSEERFSKAFRLAPVAASISSLADYRILDINDAFERITGHAKEEALGRTTASLSMWVDRAERDRVEAALAQERGYRNVEIRLQTKTGDVLDTLASAEVVTINDLPCILSMFQDITERRRSEADLIGAIEEVMQDASWFSHSIVEKLANVKAKEHFTTAGAEVVDLTKRERQVLGLMCDGWKNDQIAAELGVASNTVRNYIANIYSKVGVHTRADAVIWATARGLVTSPRKT